MAVLQRLACCGLAWLCCSMSHSGVYARGAHVPTDIAILQPDVRTTVANSLWGMDAFPAAPPVPAGGSLTIGYFNSSGGGVVTEIHLVLEGSMGTIQRHVALSITYDDLPYPSVPTPFNILMKPPPGTRSQQFSEINHALNTLHGVGICTGRRLLRRPKGRAILTL